MASSALTRRMGLNSQALLLKKTPHRHLPPNVLTFPSHPNKARIVFVFAASSSSSFEKLHDDSHEYVFPQDEGGFAEELRIASVKLHIKSMAKSGEKEGEEGVAVGQPLAKWVPTVEGYVKYLVDLKVVYDAFDRIVSTAVLPIHAEFRNTGLERSEALAKDLEWFVREGYVRAIPPPSSPGIDYAQYVEELAEKDPVLFINHLYNTYFGMTAGGRMVGKMVAKRILNNKELEAYKFGFDLSEIQHKVRDKISRVARGWSNEEKKRCLDETEKAALFSREILKLIQSC